MEGLEPATTYTLVVFAENGVSQISDKESPALISFTTEPAGKFRNGNKYNSSLEQ